MKITAKELLENLNTYIKVDKKPFIIGVAGGSGSGKSFIARKICEKIKDCVLISMDDYIIPEKILSSSNWDLPDNWDLDKIRKNIFDLHSGKKIEKPVYDFSAHLISSQETVKPCRVIIIEGIYALHSIFQDFLDFRIFIDASENVRLERRIKRDIAKRGKTEKSVREKWRESVQPVYVEKVVLQKQVADVVVLNEKKL